MSKDTFEWFEKRGVPLITEQDNRVFPKSNSSQEIINCFKKNIKKLKIKVLINSEVNSINKKNEKWIVKTKNIFFETDFLVISTGSSKKPWSLYKTLDIKIITPVPSLFSFNIKDKRILNLLGISVPNATVKINKTNLKVSRPLLITHSGMSGPAILKLSAFGARILADKNYHYMVEVNWMSLSLKKILNNLIKMKNKKTREKIVLKSAFKEIPKRLWEQQVYAAKINEKQNWASLNNKKIINLENQLTKSVFCAKGKTTFKKEFVTAGGIDLKEINFKRFESKKHKNLFFVGEVLNIDAITSGFNFQNAWTGGYICAKSIAENT